MGSKNGGPRRAEGAQEVTCENVYIFRPHDVNGQRRISAARSAPAPRAARQARAIELAAVEIGVAMGAAAAGRGMKIRIAFDV